MRFCHANLWKAGAPCELQNAKCELLIDKCELLIDKCDFAMRITTCDVIFLNEKFEMLIILKVVISIRAQIDS